MLTTTKPLTSLCACDLMSSDLVMVPADMSLQAAARILSRAQVSGAPVVDDDGRCIGILSAVDFLHWAERGGKTESKPCSCDETAWEPWQMLDHPKHSETLVREVMTANPVTAPARSPIGDLSRKMLDAHIHRILIVDVDEKPVGIVTSTDILAAVARADAGRESANEWSLP